MSFLLVIIHDLYVMRVAFSPSKTNAPLVIDPDAVLSRAVAGKGLQSVARRDPQRNQIRRRINHPLFPQGRSLNVLGELSHVLPPEYLFSFRAFE